MPGRQHLRGATPAEQRHYEAILASPGFRARYGKRAKEVAARTILAQRTKETTSMATRRQKAAARRNIRKAIAANRRRARRRR